MAKKYNKHSEEESEFLYHLPCPHCGSPDGNSMYSDGHCFCYSCDTYTATQGESNQTNPKGGKRTVSKECLNPVEQETWSLRELPARHINSETCEKFSYYSGRVKGRPAQIACYYDLAGNLVGQKLRFPDKSFAVLGKVSDRLFGQHLWNKGKKIVITEGEIDALTVAQVQNLKWPVVSIPNGVKSAKKALASNLDYLSNFEEVILMFDNDEVGRETAIECAEMLPFGKAYIASLPEKDANDCLKNGKGDEIIKAIWSAQLFKPCDIVYVQDVQDEAEQPIVMGLPWFMDTLTKATYGRRKGEVYGVGAGTGVGKTDFLTQQIAYDITVLKQKVGTIFLEQRPKETVNRVAGKIKEKRFHIPDDAWTKQELTDGIAEIGDKLVMYNSFGQTEWKTVENKIRFMAQGEDISIIYVDHLTAMAEVGNEKDSLETIMKELAMLANSLDIIITFVSHLSTPEGTPHEEGGRVAIRHFKGSRAIGFWPFFLFGLERNQQASDEDARRITKLRILKDRYTGNSVGKVIPYSYNPITGMLFELTEGHYNPLDNEDNSDEETGGF
jgi:twinkle protein